MHLCRPCKVAYFNGVKHYKQLAGLQHLAGAATTIIHVWYPGGPKTCIRPERLTSDVAHSASQCGDQISD
ncbi:hypothetical protein RRG08_055381 [Elysia crispata]|uniref:Uncharacterized protein n=1 Tax=Elysia crispata TaxID=231223 RepID=A0AAE1AST2_9GAST|nr:hypothetical protein RRG08_055381 [Elysia crispata]